jgi:cytochrome c peroxidase
MRGSCGFWIVLLVVSGVSVGCSKPSEQKVDLGPAAASLSNVPVAAKAAEAPAPAASKEFNPRLLRRFKPLRASLVDSPAPSPAQVELGRALFYETRISKTGTQSCNSCHMLENYGVDNQPTSPGAEGTRGGRNSPTVYHAAGFFAQFWDGRAMNVEEQAKGPILNPIEMGMKDAAQVEQTLRGIPGYEDMFRKAFPGDKQPLNYANVGKAIGAFERGLVTPARWDDYLKGDKNALSDAEVEGLRVFTNVGCMVCHTGEFLGGSMYQKVGAVEPWTNQKDPGRYSVTKDERDRMVFKVPSLRNIAKTAPYFHDGSAKTLPEAVQMMGRHQLGLELSQAEVASIVTWLNSLTGELPADYIKKPALPGGGA